WYWENLKNGKESLAFSTPGELKEAGIQNDLLANPDFVPSRGGVLENKEYFDAAFFGYTALEAQLTDPQYRLFLECSYEALEDAGYNPFSYRGLIGIYGGASDNFWWQAQTVLTGKRAVAGDFAATLLSDKNFLTTQAAYRLNLRGPAVVVQSACSTSLTAIHIAGRALLTGECDMALAGGVTVSPGEDWGYVYQEGMIASRDGHNRAFDAAAAGTVFGSGAGIVVLKRLKQARDQGDHIYAVILGSALNNDGSRKIGYTAPSIDGQADVIKRAIKVARVEPGT
ncbi:MAG: polyketide synthase, partial [bacterium]|nr:polyketide synthase [bacterium]